MNEPRNAELLTEGPRLSLSGPNLSTRRNLFVFGAAFALYFALWLVAAGEFVFSGLLVQDDTIYLPKALTDNPATGSWSVSVTHPLINAVAGASNGVVAPKVLSVLMAALFAAATAVLLAALSGRKTLSVLAAVFIVGYPLTTEVGVFALGAHPYFAGGAVVISAHLFLVSRGLRWPAWTPRIALSLSVIFALLATALSPIATLMPLAPLVWVLATSARSHRVRSEFAIDLGIATLPVAVALTFGLFSYHYQSTPGWTDTTIGSGIDSLVRGVATVGAPVLQGAPMTRLLYGGGFTILAAVVVLEFVRRARQSRGQKPQSGQQESDAPPQQSRVQLDAVIVLFLTGALAFGPGFAAATFRPRYAVLPFVMVAVAAAAVLLAAVSESRQPVLASAFLLLLVAGGLHAEQSMEIAHAANLETHERVAELADREAARWKENAQVVLLVPDDYAVPTSGYNHWSTWYLRSVSGRRDITGLLGHETWLSDEPFVDSYRDHGDEYWIHSGQTARRIQMKGIVPERPLYAYSLSPGGHWEREDATVFVGSDTTVVPFGGRPTSVGESGLQDVCEADEVRSLLWPTAGDPALTALGDQPRAPYSIERSYAGIRADTLHLEIPTGSTVRARLIVATRGTAPSGEYSDVEPPMPLLTGAFALYEEPSSFSIFDREANTRLATDDREESVIEIVGVEGCFLLARTAGQTMLLSNPSLSGEWSLGNGFNQRFWTGDLRVQLWSSSQLVDWSPPA